MLPKNIERAITIWTTTDTTLIVPEKEYHARP